MRRASPKRTIVWGGLTLCFLATLAEFWDYFEPLRNQLRRKQIPTELISGHPLGEILTQYGVLHPIPNNFDQFSPEKASEFVERRRIFRPETRIGSQLYALTPNNFTPFPSTAILAQPLRHQTSPVLSLSISSHSLHNPWTGLWRQPTIRGRESEHSAFVSYFENGKPQFETGVGLRIHGGGSRFDKNLTNYRLYFRKVYGKERFRKNTLFEGKGDPIRELVLRKPYLMGMAHEISRRAGAIAPFTQPVHLYINGETQGIYTLTEYLGLNYLKNHFGHSKFTFYRTQDGVHVAGNKKDYNRLLTWATSSDSPLSIEEAQKWIDAENLMGWFLSILVCNTVDAYQGPLVKDNTRSGSRWFWINWDMELSFQNVEFDIFPYLYQWPNHRPRYFILKRLQKNGPFRYRFRRFFTDKLNHELSTAYLTQLVSKYEKMAKSYGIWKSNEFKQYRNFMQKRAFVLRKQMQTHFDAKQAIKIKVLGPEKSKIWIDGRLKHLPYQGWYFPDTHIELIWKEPLPGFIGWSKSNGEILTESKLNFRQNTILTAVFSPYG